MRTRQSIAMTMREFVTARATIGRVQFLAAGTLLFLLKWLLDSAIARYVFERSWSIANYWAGNQVELWRRAMKDQQYFATMLALSLPFIWLGVLLVVARLRSARLPIWLTGLFFVPVLNLSLFAVLLAFPPREPSAASTSQAKPIRNASFGSRGGRGFAVVCTAVFGSLLTIFDVYHLGIYGVGLFVGLPFMLGAIGALLHGRSGVTSCSACVGTAVLSVSALAGALFLIAFEGAICLLMAAPIWLGCAALGGVVGYVVLQHARNEREASVVILALSLLIPVVMGAEAALRPAPHTRMVQSSIEIAADAPAVWRYVIAFPPLPEPDETWFRLGVAFPTSATIQGLGSGAERRCHFSTGDFVEPIEIWDEPNLLRFSVTQNPPPMRELTLLDDIHPPHLDGFMLSRAGQFRLVPLPDGRTLLEGTTWYQNDMSPAWYWHQWSDEIIHDIHMRVLRHIKTLVEQENFADAWTSD